MIPIIRKLYLNVFLILFICNIVLAQSSLPECEGNDKNISKYSRKHFNKMRKWTNCHGTAIGPKGQKYIGEFIDGEFHGQGIFVFPENASYEDELKNGKYYGRGMNTMSFGTYIGKFKDGKYNGKGILTLPDGRILKGTWKGNYLK